MFLISLVLACLTGAMWTVYRVVGQSSRPLIQKIFIGLVVVAAWFVPVTMKNRGSYDGVLFTFFYHIAYFAFVVAIVFFFLIVVRDFIWGILWLIEKKRLKKQHSVFVEPTDIDASQDDLMIVDDALVFNRPFELPSEGVQKTVSSEITSLENVSSVSDEMTENINSSAKWDENNLSSEIDIYDEDVLPDELKPQVQEESRSQEPVKTTSFAWKQPSFLAKTNRFLFVAAVAISVYGLYEGLKTPVVKETVIQTSRLEQPLTIVSLSDLHLHRTLQQGKINQIIKTVNQLKPDLIVLPGDTIDDDPRRIQGLIGTLKKLKAPLGVYATAGNHEFYANHEKSKKALESIGVKYLFNQGVDLKNNVYLAGVPDARSVRLISDYVDVQKALNSASDKEYKILLSHTPTLANYLQDQKVDLQISGHTHGGQIFPFHLFSWMLNGGYLAGLYELPNSKLYVSRGSGQWGPQVRLLAPSEISLIKIVPQQQGTSTSDKKGLVEKEVVSANPQMREIKKEKESNNISQPVLSAEKKETQPQPIIDKSKDKVVDAKGETATLVTPVQEPQLVQDKVKVLENVEKESQPVIQSKETPKNIEKSAESNTQNKDKKEMLVKTKPIDAGQKAVVDNIIALKSQADKEAQLTEEKAFEEAKSQMDAEFEKVLASQKALEDKKPETQRLVAQQEIILAQKSVEEQNTLRAELETAKGEAQKALEAQKEALEAVEAEKKTAQAALDAQKKLEEKLVVIQKELATQKAAETAAEKERLVLSAKQLALATKAKPIVQTVDKTKAKTVKTAEIKVKSSKLTKQTAQKAAKPTIVTAGAPVKGVTPVHKPSKIMATTTKPVDQSVAKALPTNTVQKQIDPNAVMTITTHKDGSVTRTIVRTTVQETASQIKTLKTVTSYTSTAAEEKMRNAGISLKERPTVVIQQQPLSEGLSRVPAQQSVSSAVRPIQPPMVVNGAPTSISTVPISLEKALREPKLPSGLQIY